MTLSEILSIQNDGKIFKCLDNNYKVRNDSGNLLFLNKTFSDGTQNWKNCNISSFWINAKFEPIEN